MNQEKTKFPWKWTAALLAVFGLLIAGFYLWTPFKIRYYVWKLDSANLKTKAAAAEILLNDMGKTGRAALKRAMEMSDGELDFLLQSCRGLKGDAGDELQNAVSLGYALTVELLIAKGADVNAKGSHYLPPLHTAARDGRDKVIRVLVANGVKVDSRESFAPHETPLHMAALYDNPAAVQALIELGADVNAKDTYDFTPLMECFLSNISIARMLIAAGANVNAANKKGKGPLYFAARHGNLEMAKLLLQKGAKVNKKNKINGMIPLHWAASQGDYEIAKLLLDNGAEINAKDNEGHTALDVAWEYNCEKVIDFLIKKGGKRGVEK
jgi:ankyrin repeat protein